jgi:predicted phage-related endonuclease
MIAPSLTPPVVATTELQFVRYPDRESWLEARRFSIGSSDAAALMGESNWASPLTLNYSKRGLSPVMSEDLDRAEELEWHRRREDEIACWWWERLQVKEENLYWKRVLGVNAEVEMVDPGDYTVALRMVDGVPLSATFDRILLRSRLRDRSWVHFPAGLFRDSKAPGPMFSDAGNDLIQDALVGPVELKNAAPWMAKHWREEPPLIYSLQLQHQLLVAGVRPGYMVASLGGQPPVWAEQLADGEVRHVLMATYRRFWRSVLDNEDIPADYKDVTSKAILARYAKDDGKTVTLGDDGILWWKQYRNARESAKSHSQLKEEAKNQLAQMIGEATFALLPDGTQLSYKADKAGHRRLRQIGEEETAVDSEWKAF